MKILFLSQDSSQMHFRKCRERNVQPRCDDEISFYIYTGRG
jgi:hypothetical protein